MIDERRRYFRIDDDFTVRYEPVPEGTADLRRLLRRTRSAHLGASELRRLVTRIRGTSPDVAEALQLIDERLCALETVSGARDGEAMRDDLPGLNISACGAAFPAVEEVAVGGLLSMDLVLVPGELELPVVARVVGATHRPEDAEYPWLVRVDFVEVRHDDHELLVQHVLQRQSRLIRASREEAARDQQARRA